MLKVDGSISVELGTQLQQLSELAHKSDKSDADLKNLKEISKNTLDAIDKEVITLSTISQAYLSSIRDSVSNENWNALPTLPMVRIQLHQIKSTLEAVVESMEFVSIDIETIMFQILKVQGEVMELYAKEKAIARDFQIKLGAGEIAEKRAANSKQLAAELITAGVKIGVGVVQVGMSAKSVVSAGQAAQFSKQASDMSKELASLTSTASKPLSVVQASAKKLEPLTDAVKGLVQGNKLNATKAADAATAVSNATAATAPGGAISAATSAKKQLNATMAPSESNIKTLNVQAETLKEVTSAKGAVTNAAASILTEVGNIVAALYRFDSRKDDIEAEVYRQSGMLASSAEQSALDAYQQVRNAINDLRQMLSAMMQAHSSSISSMMKL